LNPSPVKNTFFLKAPLSRKTLHLCCLFLYDAAKLKKSGNWGSMSASAKTHWKQRRTKRPPHNATRADGASAESLEAHDATEKKTNKPILQGVYAENALTHHKLASQVQFARPATWASMSQKAKKN
jgi:hypothetical protein